MKIIFALIVLISSSIVRPASAMSLDVCNEHTYKIWVAAAWVERNLSSGDDEVHITGWYDIEPGRCRNGMVVVLFNTDMWGTGRFAALHAYSPDHEVKLDERYGRSGFCASKDHRFEYVGDENPATRGYCEKKGDYRTFVNMPVVNEAPGDHLELKWVFNKDETDD
jgi:hypothetical protein